METSLDEIYNVCMFVAKYVCSEGFVFFWRPVLMGCMYVCMYVAMYIYDYMASCMFVAKYVCSEGFVFFLDTSLDEI